LNLRAERIRPSFCVELMRRFLLTSKGRLLPTRVCESRDGPGPRAVVHRRRCAATRISTRPEGRGSFANVYAGRSDAEPAAPTHT
jgi:hypothetical protein